MYLLLPLAIALAGVGAMLLLFSLKEPPGGPEETPEAPLVEVVELPEARHTFDIHVDGTVVPKHEISLAAEVAGRVTEKFPACEAGVFVKAGTPLLEIDDRAYQLEVRRLQNELKQVAVDLEQLEIEKANQQALIDIANTVLRLAKAEFERLEPLVAQQRVTKSQLDTAEQAVANASERLTNLQNALALIPKRKQRLEAQQALTQTRLELAQLDLEHTEIKAPIDGVISTENVEENDFVQRGTVLLLIEDTSVMEVRCHLRIDDLYWLWSSSGRSPVSEEQSGKPLHEIPHCDATVTFRMAGRPFTWEGFLSRYEGVGLDEKTRTVPCRVEVPRPRRDDPDGGPPTLVRGMFVEIALHVQPQTALLRIPDAAVRPQNRVWSVRGDKLVVHQVQVARVVEGAVLVRADATDLKPGDAIVITPLAVAADGMTVRVQWGD